MQALIRILPLLLLLVGSPVLAEWRTERMCGSDSRTSKPYCLELVEVVPCSLHARATLLLIPGFTQNAHIYDLLPDEGISFARYANKRFGICSKVLHVRGIGGSEYPERSRLDDIAIDDIPLALRHLSQQSRRLIVLGHSQGGITLQASLAGLQRCGKVNCFSAATAEARQQLVTRAGAIGANVDMTMPSPSSPPEILGKIGFALRGLINIPDLIAAKTLMDFLPNAGAYVPFRELLYHQANVSAESRLALFRKSIDHTTSGIIGQYADGLNSNGICNTAKERYSDYLKNITLPFTHVAFELDPLALPQLTYRDTYKRLGSKDKFFLAVPNQGHEDFMMSAKLHQSLDRAIDFMLLD